MKAQTLQLTNAFELVYHPLETTESIQARCYFHHGSPGQVPNLEILCAYIRTLLRPLWQVEYQISADWVVFELQALAEHRKQFYQELLIFFQQISPPSEDLLRHLQAQHHFKQDEKEQLLKHTLSQDFFELALNQTSYQGYFSKTQGLQNPEQLMGLHAHTLGTCPVYLHIWDTLPLAGILKEFQLHQYGLLKRLAKPQTPIFMPNQLVQTEKHHPIQGAYMYWGFLIPGLSQKSGMMGALLKHWLKVSFPTFEYPTHLDWHAFHAYGILGGHFYILRAHEIEQYMEAFLETLQQTLVEKLTPQHLQKAIHSAQISERFQHKEVLSAHTLAEILYGPDAFPDFLKHVKFKQVQRFVKQYLTESHLSIMKVLPPQIRVPEHKSIQGILPQGNNEPYTLMGPKPAGKILHHPKILPLEKGVKAHLYPFSQPQTALGVWFNKGSLTERVPGTTALLFQLFHQQIQALDPTIQFESMISVDHAWIRCVVPQSQSNRCLSLLSTLFKQFDIERDALERARLALAQEAQENSYQRSRQLEHQFWQAGFNHHPYARAPRGDYHSLRQVTPEDLEVRFHNLFSLPNFCPVMMGDISKALLERLEDAFPIFEQDPLEAIPAVEIQPRRGEVHIHSKTATPFNLQGQIFPQALQERFLAAADCLLALFHEQLKHHWQPLSLHISLLRQAWFYHFYSPAPRSFQYWYEGCVEKIQPEQLKLITYQRASHFSQRQLSLDTFWRDYLQWQALGYSWDIYLGMAQKMLKLQLEDLDTCLHKVFLPAQDNWLHLKLKV